jgi:hypothetical protein
LATPAFERLAHGLRPGNAAVGGLKFCLRGAKIADFKRGPRPQDIGTSRAQGFTADDDQAIIDWVEAYGHKRQKLTAAFPQFVPGTGEATVSLPLPGGTRG